MAALQYGILSGFLAPELVNGTRYLAPPGVPMQGSLVVSQAGATLFLAPPLFNGLPYLAEPYVLVMPDTYGGGRSRARTFRSTSTRTKSSSPAPYTRYHGRSDEQLSRIEAGLLDDEEIVLSFLMEFACV